MSQPEHASGSIGTYIVGFVTSVALTLAAYLLVARHALTGNRLLALLALLAITQLTVQLVFFLHLGKGSKQRWNLVVLGFAALVVGIVVFGSLWIMQNLNYHTHGPQNSPDTDIIKDEGVHY